MRDNPAETKKRRISLSFKLNLLITIIVLLVSALLVSISYQAYTETAYAQVREKLDRVSMEKLEENPTLLKQCGAAYRLTRLDGFQEARAAMGTEEGLLAFYEWLTGYWVNLDTGEVRDAAAQEAALSALQQQAKDAGVPEEDVNDWMWENGREFYAYYWASNFYYTFVNRFSEEANLDDFSHIRIYAEDAEGWIQIADAIPAFMREDSYDELMDYGIKLDRAAAVEAYRERPEEVYTTFQSDTGPEMARLLRTELTDAPGGKVSAWFVYSCDIAKVEESRRAFLLRSLLLVAVLVIAVIGASLLLLRRIAVRPLRKLAAAVDEFSVQQKDGERKTIVEPDVSSNDEIGDIARNFRSMQNRILEDTEHLTRMTAETEGWKTAEERGKKERPKLTLSQKQLAAYIGIVPRVSNSNDTVCHGRITKNGSKIARSTLVQCALIAKRYSPYLNAFHESVKSRRGGAKANIALARKFLDIVYKTLKNNWVFEDFTQFKLKEI